MAVVATLCPIDTICSNRDEPLNSIPSRDSDTPVPAFKTNGYVKVVPAVSLGEPTPILSVVSDNSFRNCPTLPVFLVTPTSVSIPNTTFFGVKYFWVVDLWSKLPSGSK